MIDIWIFFYVFVKWNFMKYRVTDNLSVTTLNLCHNKKKVTQTLYINNVVECGDVVVDYITDIKFMNMLRWWVEVGGGVGGTSLNYITYTWIPYFLHRPITFIKIHKLYSIYVVWSSSLENSSSRTTTKIVLKKKLFRIMKFYFHLLVLINWNIKI